ncbi:macrophage-capping protein-like isoform X2 [Brachyhypopomus gauderio]
MLPLRAAEGQFGPEVREPGLWGWRVEKMKAVRLDQAQLGVFYTGDAYLILSNRGSSGAELHMWMGEKSSRDEQCACAMLATQLDHFLDGEPVQHRQVQGYESPEFMNLFPRGVSYKEGGVESGFRRSRSDLGPVRRLYQIKGKKNVRVREVELSWSSFSRGDCYILDLGETIISWSGSKANMFERQKVREIAALIRDTERNGKAGISDVTEGEETLEMIQVLGPIPALKDCSTEEDNEADKSNSASLYKVSNASGCMTLTLLCDKAPFDQQMLERDDCFILDNGSNGKIFIWKGHGANAEEKRVALKVADEFIQEMNYCRMKTQVEILPQGRESILFKQFFKSWS